MANTLDLNDLHNAAGKGQLSVTKHLISQGAAVNKVNDNGWTALHRAAQNGHLDVTKYLISQGAAVNKGNDGGWTALHIATENGHLDVTKYLISQGVEVNKGGNDGWTALHIAARNGHLDITKYLISQGAAVNKEKDDGWTALHIAAKNGHLDVTKYLISQGAAVNKGNHGGWTALHLAAQNGHLDVTKYLISQGAAVNKGNNGGWTALHIATQNGHLDVTKYLISQGAAVNKGNYGGWTALHIATENGHLDVTKYLISQGAAVNKGNDGDWTALHLAAQNGHLDVTKYLISQGAAVNKGNDGGWTALHSATQNGHLDVTKYLNSQEAEVNKGDLDGQTALHSAARNGHLDVTKYLISQGAEVNSVKAQGVTALHSAAQNGHLDVTKYLINHGADVNKGDNCGFSALVYAATNGRVGVAKYLLTIESNIELPIDINFTELHASVERCELDTTKHLISRGTEVNSAGTLGWTALHIAATCGHLSIAKYLVSQGADINSCNAFGRTALHFAAKYDYLDAVKYLISQGAEVKRDNMGWTALTEAVRSSHLKVAEYLLDQGSKVDGGEVDVNGSTPLHQAVHRGNPDIINLLLNNGADLKKKTWSDSYLVEFDTHKCHYDAVERLCNKGVFAFWRSVEKSTRSIGSVGNGRHFPNVGDNLVATTNIGGMVLMSRPYIYCDLAIEDHLRSQECRRGGNSPLHLAAFLGRGRTTRFLVSQGADVNDANSRGWTPLHFATEKGHLSTVNYLLSQGAEVNKGDSDGITALHVAAFLGDIDVTDVLLNQGADSDKFTNTKRFTALHSGAQNGHFDVVKSLLRHGASVHKEDIDGWTALHITAHNGHLDIAKLLLLRHADVNKATAEGLAALHLSAANGHADVTRYLVEQGAETTAAKLDGRTAFHIAAEQGHLDVTTYFITQGTEVNMGDRDGYTPLHLSALKAHLEVAEVLLKEGARVDVMTAKGQTPLHLSSGEGNANISEVLAEHAKVAGSLDQRDQEGLTAVQLSIQNGHSSVVKTLISLGADLNIQSTNGKTCLHEAVILSNQPRSKVQSKENLHQNEGTSEKALVVYLLDHGARTDLEDDQGNLPYHYARDETIQKLLFSRLPFEEATNNYRVQEPLTDTVSVDVGCDATELELKHHGISVAFPHGAIRQTDSCNVTLSIVRDLPSVDIQDDESVACYGIRSDPPNMIFHQPVKIRIPHSTVVINPDQVTPDVVSHVWDSTKDLPKTTRKRSSSSPEQPPYCRIHKKHLELYIDYCAEWWVLIPHEQQVIRHQLLCTPYIPDTIERGREVKVHFHMHADVPGAEREVLNEERQQSYRKAHRSVPFSIASHSGDVTVTCECEERMNETKVLSLKEIRNQMRHKVVLTIPPGEADPYFQVITIAVSQAEERGVHVYRSTSFVLKYEDEIKGPDFSPVSREIEGDLLSELSDVNVIRIAENLSIDDFYDLGVALGFPIAQLDAMEYKRLNDRQQAICDMLMQWKQRQPTGQNTKEMLLSIVKSTETGAEKMEMTDVSSTGEISDQTLLKLARHIKAMDFTVIGTKLGFSRTKLDNIKHKALQNRKEANIQMLTMWKASQRSVAEATETLKYIWESVSSASRTEPDEDTDESVLATSSAVPLKRTKPVDSIEHEDMDILSASYAGQDETIKDVGQGGGTPAAEELCSVARPVKNLAMALAIGKALRLNDDDIVGFISLPSPSALLKISRQLMDSWWNRLNKEEKDEHLCKFLRLDQMSKAICSKTELLDLCHHLSRTPSDILQIMRTSLTFPPYMISRSALEMLVEWVHRGGTRVRLLQVVQAFRFNDAAAETAEAIKCQPGYTPLMSHATIDHHGGELTLEELGITVSFPEGAIPKGMRSVVTIQVPTQCTPRIPLQDGEVLISPVVVCSLTQELLKPATIVVPHCTEHLEGEGGRTVFLYTKTGPGTFGRRNLSSSTLRGFAILNDNIKFRTHHVQVWALCTADIQRLQFRCVAFEPLFMPPSGTSTLHVYVVHPYTDYIKDITRKEKSSSVPNCQVMKEFKFSLESKAGDLKICCKNGSKRAEEAVLIENLLNGKCSPLSFELQFSPEDTGKKTIHLTILQGSSTLADKEFTTSVEVEPDYQVDNTDSHGRLEYVSDNLFKILSDLLHTP